MKRLKGSSLFAVLLGGLFSLVIILSSLGSGASTVKAAMAVQPVGGAVLNCCPPGGFSKCSIWNCPIFVANPENTCGRVTGFMRTETTPAIACSADSVLFNLCKQAGPKFAACVACIGNAAQPSKMYTAIGCIPTDFNGMVTTLVRFGLGLAGGILLLIILNAAFQMATSQGDPKVISEAQASFTAAISGLLFIIFSVLIMETIGVKILYIPGF